MNYYNEFNREAAAWLRELIAARLIPAGEVDERSITEVKGYELKDYRQCHFFAGIGGWALALRLAGWADDRPVWTGSCPCQPFSCNGKGLGEDDERHLWPFFRNLIGERRPRVVLGEQVASAAGRAWLAGVSADVEKLGYCWGGADLCAAGVGAPHIRQRLFWVADAEHSERRTKFETSGARIRRTGFGGSCRMGDTMQQRLEGQPWNGDNGHESRRVETESHRSSAASGAACDWKKFNVIPFRDGKTRRIESGTFPLAHGIPGRVGLLRGYGNAIVPQLAAEFIQAYEESRQKP